MEYFYDLEKFENFKIGLLKVYLYINIVVILNYLKLNINI